MGCTTGGKFSLTLPGSLLSLVGRGGCGSHSLWKVWRCFAAALMLSIMLWSISSNSTPRLWAIYLTNITLVLQVIYHFLAVAVTFKQPKWDALGRQAAASADPEAYVSPPTLVSLNWAFMNVVYPGALAVALLFWLLVYEGGTPRAVSVATHGINFVVIAIDAFFTAHPFYLKHFWMVQVYGVLYLIWTIIHSLVDVKNPDGDDYVYETLNWNKPGGAAAYGIVIVVIILPIFHAMMTGIHRVGNRVVERKLIVNTAVANEPQQVVKTGTVLEV